MAGTREIRAVGPSAPLADRKSSVQRSVNLFMRQSDALGEDAPVVLASAPGMEQTIAFAADVRGSYATDTRMFQVAGNTLYETTTLTAVSRGTLATSTGFVSMVHGVNQLVIVDGANGYVLNLDTNVFGQITSAGWRGSNWVEELDGYFIFAAPGSDQFYISAIDDASTLDALDFSSADTNPDLIVTHRKLRRELIIFGTVSSEVWIDTGNADFPFERYNSTPIDVGCVGVRAAARTTDSILWLGRTERGQGYVYELQGHAPVRVSTQAVEEALSAVSDLSGAVLWSYHVRGSEFVGVKHDDLPTTWVFDLATRQWHERAEVDPSGDWAQSRVDAVVHFAGQHYASGGPAIYRLSDSLHTIAGDPLRRERTWPHLIAPSMEPMQYRGLELGCTTGYGGTITLEVSNNGGFTFGPPLLRSLGATGQWMQRVRWLMLGSARDRVFRLRCSDDVPLTITSATLDAG